MKQRFRGLRIESVLPGSPASKAGLRRGDIVVSVDGERVSDELEFGFFSARSQASIDIIRNNTALSRTMTRPDGHATGVRFRKESIKRCGNRCIFCFVDQMPRGRRGRRGLRQSLYIKDEDYRLSFTNGNYITLSRMSEARLSRIAELGLSPLYVSVHATETMVRRRMLGNPDAPDIMRQLRFLEKNNIRFHTQIVLCPGVNDGRVLRNTIGDLLALKQGLLSIAIVPVGLTRHRRFPLVPVNKQTALEICRQVKKLGDRLIHSEGRRCIFCADELFLAARLPIPGKTYYENYPQIENGVGLIRQFLEEWKELKKRMPLQLPHYPALRPPVRRSARFLVITSRSALKFVKKVMEEVQSYSPGILIEAKDVRNLFFGETVTVAGLLTAQDVIRTVRPVRRDFRCVFLPSVMFNTNGFTLDGHSLRRIGKALGVPVKAVSTISEVVAYVGKK